MRRWSIVLLSMIVVGLLAFGTVSAHASLVRSSPLANTAVATSPAEIRLWFTEPLEPDFSRIFLRDKDGNLLSIPPSAIDNSDQHQMYVVPGVLPDGLYTVVWRVVSSADGHPTQGSFPFIVGEAGGGFGITNQDIETIPLDNSAIRWANLFSLSLAVGGMAFWMFVWNPAGVENAAPIRRRMWIAIWAGWMLVGVTGILLMLMQYAIVTGFPLFTDINSGYLEQLISGTRFGHLWLARMALWVGMGLSLVFAATDRWFFPVALVLGFAVLLTNSLFSHANAARDLAISVGADWLHLVATALWIGGLIQFVNVIDGGRRLFNPAAPILSKLVGYFTNFARVSVTALVITGFYSAWLQVGSVSDLFVTPYGQTFLIKLILFIPVFGLAAVNMVYTHRALAAGQELWSKRLRGLLSAEIVITVAILGVVGVMTSIAPTRTVMERRALAPQPPEPQPVIQTLTADDLNAELTIAPGWVGENTFTLKLTDSSGAPVTDATLIRMRFESQEQNLGESELRPTHQGDGVYTISGANLSVPGEWRIRTTVQRPDRFDGLVDFRPTLVNQPPPITPIPPDPNMPFPNRTLILLLVGVSALMVGGFFLGENRLRPPLASSLLALGLLVLGISFMATGIVTLPTATSASDFTPPPDAPVRLGVSNNPGLPLPYLITGQGDILQPSEDSTWVKVPLDARARDVYIDPENRLWVSANDGFYTYQDGAWEKQVDRPAQSMSLMHGYAFIVENRGVTRLPAGGTSLESPLQLPMPLADQPVEALVMLGNHDHVLQIGSSVYVSYDLGLSWEAMNAPQPVNTLGVDPDGALLAVTESGILSWNIIDKTWSNFAGLPGGDSSAILRVYNQQLFAIAKGQLYRKVGDIWESVNLGAAGGAHLTALEFLYPNALWALDARDSRLWSTTDGENWREINIVVSN